MDFFARMDSELRKTFDAATASDPATKKTSGLSMLVSFAKVPQYAVNYAIGKCSIAYMKHHLVVGKYRNTGQPKHSRLGTLTLTMHSLDEYSTHMPSDVPKAFAEGQIAAGPCHKYLNATEVCFPGGVSRQHIASVLPLKLPDFYWSWTDMPRDHREDYKKNHGLDRINYEEFRSQLQSTKQGTEDYKKTVQDIRTHLIKHVSNQAIIHAKTMAQNKDKHMVFRMPDGQFKLFDMPAEDAKKEIVRAAKDINKCAPKSQNAPVSSLGLYRKRNAEHMESEPKRSRYTSMYK